MPPPSHSRAASIGVSAAVTSIAPNPRPGSSGAFGGCEPSKAPITNSPINLSPLRPESTNRGSRCNRVSDSEPHSVAAVARVMRVGGDPRQRSSTLLLEMSNPHPQPSGDGSLELPVDALLANARPFPSHAEMVIEDLTPDEGAEFLAALQA